MRTRIKICGLTREQDVDAVAQAGADAAGFVLYDKSPRHVLPHRAAVLARRLPAFVTPVLLFVNATPGQVRQACELIPNAVLQFHGDETPQQCLMLAKAASERPHPRAFLRAARIPLQSGIGETGVAFDLVKYAHDYAHAQAILLDAQVEGYGGGGKTFEWSQLPPNVNAHLVLSGGLTPANVGDGIRLLRPRCKSLAVDVSSGVEASKGVKDAGKIQAFVAAVRAQDTPATRA
ncbi:phosphoribosylanthranilate isomerase [Hylemonella gracilis]|uniref:N-(5'-phosphoribosyl)anthranilate isomerase n=1 Tax=Hylemonella gracilis TaxID=80880 RepID=A0A4P6UI14_9BURK|nr:phosphoribosylanthranilate isomerase [Hylemonella gracilis]QBK04958.1 phosphoribosylanthranilate isomerase [Hylemonella gracilis]